MEAMITIFTPVYNRAHMIGQLYQSLIQQVNFNFEWLVIDDGSDDGIEDIFYKWMKEERTPFKIRFYRQKNGGKHRAVNRGVELAEGEAFFIVDSDDYITKDAVCLIHQWWEQIADDNSFAGISGFRGKRDGKRIGDVPSFKTFVDATNLERGKYGLLGDKAEVYKTSVLKQYPFPEFTGENFLTEAVIWDKIAYDGLKIRWFNRIITICEYREDGLTNQGKKIFLKNPRGWGLYIHQTCIFYQLPEKERIIEYFKYYIKMKNIIGNQEVRRNLVLDEGTWTKIEQLYNSCIQKTIDRIGNKIAVYGVGNRGQELIDLYKGSEIEVCYILDKRKANLPYLQVDLNDAYPPVDAIIITPKDEQAEIMEFLDKRTKNRLMGYDEWKIYVSR